MAESIQCDDNKLTETVRLIKKGHSQSRGPVQALKYKYRRTRKCIGSKAALLILLWSFAVALAYSVVLNPDIYMQVLTFGRVFIGLIPYGIIPIVLCFFPLAGFLADTKYGRYKTVTVSLYVILLPMALLVVPEGLILPMKMFPSRIILIWTGFGLVGLCLMVIIVGFVGFTANVIQFGMDQLHDSPAEDQSLFIHWYVWIYYMSVSITQLGWNLVDPYILILHDPSAAGYTGTHLVGLVMIMLIPLVVAGLLILSLCVACHRQRWFLIEPGRVNPYIIVHKVTKFASQHKIPVRRSAFTYCEDELPSGLDLGKNKYGGPFTTEQVEDVKAFYGILKVLFSFGAVFFLDFIANSMLPVFARHDVPHYDYNGSTVYNETMWHHILIGNGLLSPLLIVVCIPLYICLIHPFVSHYVPGMLKRMGIGMLLVLLSITATFIIDTIAQSQNRAALCMFSDDNNGFPPPSNNTHLQDTTFLIIQHILSALSNMLIYIGVLEFICSQSPHSMKGLLIGLSYTIKGFFQLVAAIATVPFYAIWNVKSLFPSCGSYYYLMGMVIGVVALIVYVWVARKYKRRERDEPSNIRRYAEDYYSQDDYKRF